MRFAALAVLGLTGLAAAEPVAWKPTRGTMQPGVDAGSFILTSDAAPARYSNGEVVSTSEVALPYRFDIRWRRLGPEAGRSMHVTVAGGVLLFRTGRMTLYAFDEVKLAAEGWRTVPALAVHDEQAITVIQDRHAITVLLEGKQIARFTLEVPNSKSIIGVGMKAAPGFRSSIYVRSLVVGSQ